MNDHDKNEEITYCMQCGCEYNSKTNASSAVKECIKNCDTVELTEGKRKYKKKAMLYYFLTNKELINFNGRSGNNN